MPFIRLLPLILAGCAVCASVLGQETGKTSTANAEDVDMSALIHETQQSVNTAGYAGLIWWIPTRYWEISLERAGFAAEKAQQRYSPLKKYTVVAIALGKIGIGNINWFPEPEIKDNVTLRDAEGNTYQAVQKLSGDAEGLASIMKPVFSNILGQAGQNIQLLFFPATDKMAKPIADPLAPGSFSIVLTKLFNGKDKTFEWKLPLTALSPPKYCPVGKERVQANWKYCPWHGVKLDDNAGASAVSAPNSH